MQMFSKELQYFPFEKCLLIVSLCKIFALSHLKKGYYLEMPLAIDMPPAFVGKRTLIINDTLMWA